MVISLVYNVVIGQLTYPTPLEVLVRRTKKKEGILKDSELYDIVIVLLNYNKINPRRRWSDIAEKIMSLLGLSIVYENGEEFLLFDDEDKEFV